jgi:uncharacterized membrane protein
MKSHRHLLLLAIVLLIGTLLRFWNLDLKPLWLDEVITALISTGRGYKIVPLEVAFPLSTLEPIFTLKPNTTCGQITQLVTTQSVHPPLFFCWLNDWLNRLSSSDATFAWKLRSLPALAGVGMIAAVYWLNRTAFSGRAGLFAAMTMAVSPFAVYLSQEARHYTIPMLLITLALAGLVRLLQGLRQQQRQIGVWLGWIVVNSLGFYVHYFFVLAFVAQVIALVTVMWRSRSSVLLRQWGEIGLASSGVVATYLLWLPTFLNHMIRPETDWLKASAPVGLHLLAPLYQFPIGWLTMIVTFPVENQPLWVTIPAVLLMLLVAIWLIQQLNQPLRQLWQNPATHPETALLVYFLGVVLLQFLVIIYILGKDITVVPRYNFVYYPAVCALIGAGLWQKERRSAEAQTSPLLPSAFLLWTVGLLSCVFVVNNLAFQKPYSPQETATYLNQEPTIPQVVAMGYADLQDVALGLSFALEMHKLEGQLAERGDRYFTFLPRSQGYEPFWQKLPQLQLSPLAKQPVNTEPNLDLWVIAPELKRNAFPEQLSLSGIFAKTENPLTCKIEPEQYRRVGIPYQLYRCQDTSKV